MARRYAADPDFVEYVRARQHALLRAAYLICGDVHLAEDLLQGALIKLAERWPRLRSEYPDAYVRQILYRDAVSAWRKRRREVVGLVDADEAVEPARPGRPGGPHDPVGGVVVDRVDLQRALMGLTARQRAVLVLRFLEDRTVVETASILGVSTGTVKSQTHVALGRLRDLVPDIAEGAAGEAPGIGADHPSSRGGTP